MIATEEHQIQMKDAIVGAKFIFPTTATTSIGKPPKGWPI